MKNQMSTMRQGNSKGRKSSAEAEAKPTNGKAHHEASVAPRIASILESDAAPIATIESVRTRKAKELDKTTLLAALLAFKGGDFSVRLPIGFEGMDGKIADVFNEVIERNERMSKELERLSRVVGKEGKISQRAEMGEVTGAWKESVESVNALIGDLVHPTSETASVI